MAFPKRFGAAKALHTSFSRCRSHWKIPLLASSLDQSLLVVASQEKNKGWSNRLIRLRPWIFDHGVDSLRRGLPQLIGACYDLVEKLWSLDQKPGCGGMSDDPLAGLFEMCLVVAWRRMRQGSGSFKPHTMKTWAGHSS